MVKKLQKITKNYKIEDKWLQKDIKLPMFLCLRKFGTYIFCVTIICEPFLGLFEGASTFLTPQKVS